MPGRLPTRADFPSSAVLSITPPPPTQAPTNLLVLLHGLGDTHASFTALARQLNLPETACIALQAPSPLPFDLGGFHWGDDLVLDEKTGDMETDTGFERSTRLVLDGVLKQGLMGACGYKAREIVLFGYGQGGMAALQVAAESAGEELGGVVSVGGGLSLSLPLKAMERPTATPVLLCKAARGSAVTGSAVKRLRDAFRHVEVVEWQRRGDGMPRGRDEMLPVMRFFARRLRSVRGVPDGSVELG